MFTHATSDVASFRMYTSQLIVQGSATQGQVARAFGVPLVAIKRGTKRYRERSAAGFFVPKPRREGSKLNAEKLEQARALPVQGHPLAVVSRQTGVLTDTLRKTIRAGRLPAVIKKPEVVNGDAIYSTRSPSSLNPLCSRTTTSHESKLPMNQENTMKKPPANLWNQWRGPFRNGVAPGCIPTRHSRIDCRIFMVIIRA